MSFVESNRLPLSGSEVLVQNIPNYFIVRHAKAACNVGSIFAIRQGVNGPMMVIDRTDAAELVAKLTLALAQTEGAE